MFIMQIFNAYLSSSSQGHIQNNYIRIEINFQKGLGH